MNSGVQASRFAKRVMQTRRAFVNWRSVLVEMAWEKVGRGPGELTFETRSGLRVCCPNVPGARVPIYEIFAEDCYHFEWFLGPLGQRPLQVLDVGGQVGTFACRLAQIHPLANIRSFEPSPTSASFLRRNVWRNNFDDRIKVVQLALASAEGTAEFDDNGAGSGENSLSSRPADGRAHGSTITVPTTTFDTVIAAMDQPAEFVKIDCEGGEYDLVYGSSQTSWSSVRRLVIEYHPVPGQRWDELRAWFAGVGLTVQLEEVSGEVGVAWLSRDPLVPLTTPAEALSTRSLRWSYWRRSSIASSALTFTLISLTSAVLLWRRPRDRQSER